MTGKFNIDLIQSEEEMQLILSRYVQGQLDEEAAAAVEARIGIDDKWASELQLQQIELEIGKTLVRTTRRKMEDWEKERELDWQKKRSIFSDKRFVIGLVLLLVIVGFAVKYLWTKRNKPEIPHPPALEQPVVASLIEDFYEKPDFSNTMGAGSDGIDLLKAAGEQFMSASYQKVIDTLGRRQFTGEQYLTSRQLLAHANFALEKYDTAINLFKDYLSISEITSQQQKAEWALLLAYSSNLEKYEQSFEALLQSILATENHLYYQKALILRERL